MQDNTQHLDGNTSYAPGWPGIAPRWTSSAKSGVGTALNAASRVWFTLSHGILNEIYYPRVDQRLHARPGPDRHRRRRLLLRGETRMPQHVVQPLAEGVPAYRLINTCPTDAIASRKRILADPPARRGAAADHVSCRCRAPRRLSSLCAAGAAPGQCAAWGNTAWVGDYKGTPMLFAERDGSALALACFAAMAEDARPASSASPTAGRTSARTSG